MNTDSNSDSTHLLDEFSRLWLYPNPEVSRLNPDSSKHWVDSESTLTLSCDSKNRVQAPLALRFRHMCEIILVYPFNTFFTRLHNDNHRSHTITKYHKWKTNIGGGEEVPVINVSGLEIVEPEICLEL